MYGKKYIFMHTSVVLIEHFCRFQKEEYTYWIIKINVIGFQLETYVHMYIHINNLFILTVNSDF